MLALCACKADIETFEFRGDEHLCVNGIINNLNAENHIYCSFLSCNKRTIISKADIRIYVNGNLAETVSNGDGQGKFQIKSKFKAGDHVRLEVSAAEATVWAEVDVPLPVEITQLDTIMTKTTFENWDDDAMPEDIYRVKASIKTPYPDGGYYRLVAGGEADNVYGWAETDYVSNYWDSIPDYNKLCDSICHDRINCPVEIKEDMALTDGKGFVESDDADFLGFTPLYFNNYSLFTGEYFNGDSYTLQFYLQPWFCVCPLVFPSGDYSQDGFSYYDLKYGKKSWLKDKYYRLAGYSSYENENYRDYDELTWNNFLNEFYPDINEDELDELYIDKLTSEYHEWYQDCCYQYVEKTNYIFAKSSDPSMFCQVISISKEEYLYLRARSNQFDTDFYSPLTEPITMPSNIHGGLGVFFIENATEKTVKIPASTLIGASWNYNDRHWVSVPRG